MACYLKSMLPVPLLSLSLTFETWFKVLLLSDIAEILLKTEDIFAITSKKYLYDYNNIYIIDRYY